MALDARRYGWSHVPPWAQGLGAALIPWSFWGWTTVLRANSFAAVDVRVRDERNQTVISTGPYAVVRHPRSSPVDLGAMPATADQHYYVPVPATDETLALMVVIDATFMECPWYEMPPDGQRRNGHEVGRRRA